MGDRLAEDRKPAHGSSALRRRALGLERLLVLGLGLCELLLSLDEDVLAAGAGLDHE